MAWRSSIKYGIKMASLPLFLVSCTVGEKQTSPQFHGRLISIMKLAADSLPIGTRPSVVNNVKNCVVF
jgi:hypothetical protein